MAIANHGSDPAPETVRVKHPDGYAVINKADFVHGEHELFDAVEDAGDANPLAGNTAAVKAHVDALADVAALTALLAAETSGAARAGVLKAIEKRIAALASPAE